MRAAAAVVLVGYGLILGAAPTGHGLRFAAHLLAEHHATVDAVLFGVRASAHDHAQARTDVHTHDGVAHSHDETPSPPAIATVALDKHTLAPPHTIPADAEARTEAEHVFARAPRWRTAEVETRPPQTNA